MLSQLSESLKKEQNPYFLVKYHQNLLNMGLFKRVKNNDKPVIRQILDLIPDHLVRGGIQKYQTDKYCHKYKTRDQLVALLFGQL